MIISQSGIVDLIPEFNRQLRPIFCVSEGDNGTRTINMTVQNAGENYAIPTGATVYVVGKKADNTTFTYRCSFSGYIVNFTLTEQMSAYNGLVLCELKIVEDGAPLGSANFVYWVEPSPIQNGTASDSDLNIFEEAIAAFAKFDHFYADVESMVAEAVQNIQIKPGQTVIDASLTVEGAAADAAATGNIVRSFLDALVTEETTEAAIATCDDAAGGLPLKKLTVTIEPTQAGSGDPSPTNVRAISGYSSLTVTRTGKNLIDETQFSGSAWTNNGDGTYTLRKNGSGLSACNGTLNLNVKPGETYTFSADIVASSLTAGNALNVGYVDDVNSVVTVVGGHATLTMTAAKGSSQLRLYISSGSAGVGSDYITLKNIQLEYDDTATAYEPYTGATYSVTFPSSAGTVYGGTLTVNSDGGGALTVDRAIATPTAFTAKGGSSRNNMYRFAKSYAPDLKPIGANTQRANLISNEFVVGASYQEYYNGSPTDLVGISQNAGGDIFCSFGATDNPTLEDANTWLTNNPLQVVYELETPTTYALSAVEVVQMLTGDNAIWTDAAGTLSGEYYANTALYVQKLVNAQRGMIAGVESTMTATKNYARNDLLIVGNTLYNVTAAIANGAALVVGTNVAETTVAEQLLALA